MSNLYNTSNSSTSTELSTAIYYTTSSVSSSLNTFFTPHELYLITFALVLISVVGTFQNLMIIAAVFLSRNRLLEIPSSWFVLSLATADLLVCGVSVPMYIFHLHAYFWGPFLAFGHLTTLVSAGSLALLTFNRFLSIYDTLGYPTRMTTLRAQLLAFGIWIVSICLTAINSLAKIHGADYIVFLSIVYYVIINILTAVFHSYMFRVSWIKKKTIRGQRIYVLSGQQKNALQEYNHLLRLVIIVGTYVITWVPFIATLSATPEDKKRQSRSFQRQFALFYTLLSMNSAIDPFLYFLRSDEFKSFIEKLNRMLARTQHRVEPQINTVIAFHIHGISPV